MSPWCCLFLLLLLLLCLVFGTAGGFRASFRSAFLHYRLPLLTAARGWSDCIVVCRYNTVQKHSWNNSCSPPPLPAATTSFTPPLLIVSNQLYLLNMKTGLLQGRLGRLHCMQRSWSAPDKRPQLPNERQLHHCLHVTDGWQRWQIGGINWWGYQGQTSLHFRASLALFFFSFWLLFFQLQGAFLFKYIERMRETVGLVRMLC